MNEKEKFYNFKYPTKKFILTYLILLSVGNFLIVLSITNFFTEIYFNKKYMMMYYLMILSILPGIKLIFNYKKRK